MKPTLTDIAICGDKYEISISMRKYESMNKYESPFSCIFSGVLSMLQMVYLFTLHHENESGGYSNLPMVTAPECFA